MDHSNTGRLPSFFAAKAWVDAFAARTRVLPEAISDHLLQAVSRLFQSHLPTRMLQFRNRFAHHLILKVESGAVEATRALLHALYYGLFFCHVFHQDYVVARGTDATALEHRLWRLLDERGARYPAEHNVGHVDPATAELADHYRKLDPCNVMNPGIGKTSKRRMWA